MKTNESYNLDETLGKINVLTIKERAVLKLLVEGLSDKEIGQRIGIKFRTVRTHVEHIFGKLGVDNRKELIVKILTGKRASLINNDD